MKSQIGVVLGFRFGLLAMGCQRFSLSLAGSVMSKARHLSFSVRLRAAVGCTAVCCAFVCCTVMCCPAGNAESPESSPFAAPTVSAPETGEPAVAEELPVPESAIPESAIPESLPVDQVSGLNLEPVVIDDLLMDEEVVEGSVVISDRVVQTSEPAVVTPIEPDAVPEIEPDGHKVQFGDWVGYNATQNNTTWLAGGDFGMYSMESYPSLDFGDDSSIKLTSGFHFLDGPRVPDMPPRLFDFQVAFQGRRALTDHTMVDVRLGVGVFSDFEGSARKGVRYPGHLVTYWEYDPGLAVVSGVEVLDRDDLSVLPVAGLVWRPVDDLVLECVFPRPRIQLRLDSNKAMHFGGELGGGTWAIKRLDGTNDNVTYRDLRVTWGISNYDEDDESTMEIGWAFDRWLGYRSASPDTHFDGAFLLRWHKHY